MARRAPLDVGDAIQFTDGTGAGTAVIRRIADAKRRGFSRYGIEFQDLDEHLRSTIDQHVRARL